MGEVIGVGIFLTPAGMAKTLGSPFWLLAVWLTMGVAAVGGALCYGALAAMYPEAGGSYVYLREVYGPRTAFLYGWLSLAGDRPGPHGHAGCRTGELCRSSRSAVSLGAKGRCGRGHCTLAAVNILGVSLGSRVLGTLAALKLGLLGFLVVWGFSLGRGDWANLTPFWSQRPGSEPLFKAWPAP